MLASKRGSDCERRSMLFSRKFEGMIPMLDSTMSYFPRIQVKLLLAVILTVTSVGWFSGTFVWAADANPRLVGGRFTLNLSGPHWQMEGIRPGQGLKEGFHETFGEVAPSTFNWNGARVPGDVYTDLWRAGLEYQKRGRVRPFT